MKISILSIISYFFLINIGVCQWVTIGGYGNQTQMIGNGLGYRHIATYGSTPAAGSTYKIYRTENDWAAKTLLYYTTQGGYGCCTVDELYFLDTIKGFYIENSAGNYYVNKTVNGGNNWFKYLPFLGFPNGFIKKNVFFLNDTLGYISCNTSNGYLLKYFNDTIKKIYEIDSLVFSDAKSQFISPDIGFFLLRNKYDDTYNFLFKTSDGGNTMTLLFVDSINKITSVFFTDSLVGYLSAKNGIIYKTTNGGNDWITLNSPTGANINQIAFINDTIGYIACDSAKIFKTLNAGITWFSESSGSSSNILSIYFVDSITAYAVDANNLLLKNSNALSIIENSSKSFDPLIAFPNPVLDKLSIIISEKATIEIININGLNIKTLIYDKGRNSIDVSDLSSGIYIIKVTTDKGIVTKKFIKL